MGTLLELRRLALLGTAFCLVLRPGAAEASDHLDTPSVIADPAADIADLYAWTSTDGQRLNLVMTLVAHQFSDRLQYVFHVGSGSRLGETTANTSILCRFDRLARVECWAGDVDHLRGDASNPAGLEGRKARFRVFAGLRDDPFFNNVKGTRAALEVARAALKRGTVVDPSGCPLFDQETSRAILEQWRHTDGGPARNFLAGWQSAALVIAVDLDVVNRGGKLLAVWGGTYRASPGSSSVEQGAPSGLPPRPALDAPVDRIGRPLTGNALIGPLAPDEVSDARKEAYNRAGPGEWPRFVPDIAQTLGLYDGLDGKCGNQWLADARGEASRRYQSLASILADDRLWIDSRSTVCTQYLALELAELGPAGSAKWDCGGRTPGYDASNVFRSLLVLGATRGAGDGLERDDHLHSTTQFPFLAPP